MSPHHLKDHKGLSTTLLEISNLECPSLSGGDGAIARLSLRATPHSMRGSAAIRRSRCEGEARGNLMSSFASLRKGLRSFYSLEMTLRRSFSEAMVLCYFEVTDEEPSGRF